MKHPNFARVMVYIITLVGCLLVTTNLFATDSSWYDFNGENGLVSVLMNIRKALSGLLKVILLIGSGGAGTWAIIQLMQGERSSARRIFIWFVGMLIGFVVISVLGKLGNYNAKAGVIQNEIFSTYFIALKDLLIVAMTIVSLVTVVQKVFQVINGEQDGSRQLFKWFAVSLVGITLLSLI